MKYIVYSVLARKYGHYARHIDFWNFLMPWRMRASAGYSRATAYIAFSTSASLQVDAPYRSLGLLITLARMVTAWSATGRNTL